MVASATQMPHNVQGADDADQHSLGIQDIKVVDAQGQQTFNYLTGRCLRGDAEYRRRHEVFNGRLIAAVWPCLVDHDIGLAQYAHRPASRVNNRRRRERLGNEQLACLQDGCLSA
jgi:hypothetical protein